MLKNVTFLAVLLLLVCFGPAGATGGGIFTVGGQDNNGNYLNVVQLQADTTSPWETGPPIRLRENHAAASHDGMIYAIGSYVLTLDTTVEMLDTSNLPGGWSNGPRLQTARNHLAAAALNGVLYAIGGFVPKKDIYVTYLPTGSVEMLDTSDGAGRWSSGPTLQSARGYHAAVALNDILYVIGGCTYDKDYHTICISSLEKEHTVEMLDTSDLAGKWSYGPPLLTSRNGHAVAALNGKLYVVGGGSGEFDVAPIEILDTSNLQDGWSYGPILKRRNLAAATLNGMIIAIGGINHIQSFSTTRILDPNNLAGGWSYGEDIGVPRRFSAAGAITEKGEVDVEHISCDGTWSCDDSCTASFTKVTSQSGNGAACPTQYTCRTGPSCDGPEILARLGVLTAPMQIDEGGSYIYTPDEGVKGSSYTEPPTGGAIFYVLASTSTTVELECEVLTPDGFADSFFVWFDDAPFFKWETGIHTSFEWTPVGKAFTLSAGPHTLHIGLREDGAQMRTLRISSGDAVFTVSPALCPDSSTRIETVPPFLCDRGTTTTTATVSTTGWCLECDCDSGHYASTNMNRTVITSEEECVKRVVELTKKEKTEELTKAQAKGVNLMFILIPVVLLMDILIISTSKLYYKDKNANYVPVLENSLSFLDFVSDIINLIALSGIIHQYADFRYLYLLGVGCLCLVTLINVVLCISVIYSESSRKPHFKAWAGNHKLALACCILLSSLKANFVLLIDSHLFQNTRFGEFFQAPLAQKMRTKFRLVTLLQIVLEDLTQGALVILLQAVELKGQQWTRLNIVSFTISMIAITLNTVYTCTSLYRSYRSKKMMRSKINPHVEL